MTETVETILNELRATAVLDMGSERLRLFFTPTRIIVAHGGKYGTPTVTGSFLGGLSGGLESLFRRGGKSPQQGGKRAPSPGEILALDKDNFAISYNEVVAVVVTETLGRTGLKILTKGDKFQFLTGMNWNRLMEMLSGTVLKDRISVERTR
jgi:hypothetical protein